MDRFWVYRDVDGCIINDGGTPINVQEAAQVLNDLQRQVLEYEKLVQSLINEPLVATPADAALADDALIELVTDYAQSKVRAESCRYRYESAEYDKEAAETLEQIRAALRARQPAQAVADDALRALIDAAQMAVEMIETNKHERRYVRWALKDAMLAASKGGST